MKIYDRDDYKFTREAVAMVDALERMAPKAKELVELAEVLESAGKPVSAYLRSQLTMVLLMDCLGSGRWEEAREHCLTLAELLPDFPPILAVLFR